MASTTNNPRPQFMAQLKDLCRDLEKKVTDVDMETRATLHCNRVRSEKIFVVSNTDSFYTY